MVNKRTVRLLVLPLVASLALFGLEGFISLVFGNLTPAVKTIVGFGGAYATLQIVQNFLKIEVL